MSKMYHKFHLLGVVVLLISNVLFGQPPPPGPPPPPPIPDTIPDTLPRPIPEDYRSFPFREPVTTTPIQVESDENTGGLQIVELTPEERIALRMGPSYGLYIEVNSKHSVGAYIGSLGFNGIGLMAEGNRCGGLFKGKVQICRDWTIHDSPSALMGFVTYSPMITFNPTSTEVADFKGNVVIRSQSTNSKVVELGEGLDYAEGFDVAYNTEITPGMVLCIDSKNPGRLTVSKEPYDRCVAGIVTGAKGKGSGVLLGVEGYDCNVALAGRVYCNVDATEHAVIPGDLLTTSSTPGYAMKVTDYTRAQGAILGKAMGRLDKGEKGQILVLVALQ